MYLESNTNETIYIISTILPILEVNKHVSNIKKYLLFSYKNPIKTFYHFKGFNFAKQKESNNARSATKRGGSSWRPASPGNPRNWDKSSNPDNDTKPNRME